MQFVFYADCLLFFFFFVLTFYLNLRCRCYIKLYDSPPKSSTGEDDDMSNLLPSQKKKMRQKQRKAEARAKKVLWFIIACYWEAFSLC